MDGQVKVKLGADDAELQASLQRSGAAMETFGKKVSMSTFLARDAVLDLGHTVRDLPYAMSNPALLTGPIDRVAQLFTQISAQGGGAKAALQAISGALSGPGGILIGFELLTTAATFFFGSASKGADQTKKQVESLSESIKKIPLLQSEAAASEAGNIAKIEGLAAVISDTNLAYKERKNALEQLKEINKAYFGDLTLEDAATGKLTKTIQEYTKALVNEAIQKKFVNEIADAAKKAADADDARAKALTKVEQAQQAVNKANANAIDAIGGREGVSETHEQITAQNKLAEAQEELAKANDDVTDSLTEQIVYTDKLNKAIAEGAKFKTLKTDTSETDALKKQIEATQKLRDELDKLGFDSTDVTEKLIGLKKQLLSRDSVKLGLSSDEINLQIIELNRELQNAFDKQGARLEFKIHPSLDIKPADLAKLAAEADKLENPFSKAVEKLYKQQHPTQIFSEKQLQAMADGERHMKKLSDEATNMQKIFAKDLAPAFDNFFTEIIDGKGLQALADLGKALAEIIKKYVEAALEALIFNAIIGAVTGGVSGAGFGGAQGFKNIFGQLSGINLNSVNSGGIAGAALNSIILQPSIAVHGNDLRILLNRVDKTNNRIH